jgi:hypothetical protein
MERCLPADRANVQNNTIFWAGTPADFSIPQSEGDPGHEFNGQRGAPHQHASAAPRLHRRGPHMGAERYQVGDVLRYSRASKETGIGKGAYLQVKSIDAPNNRLTVELQDGREQTYDPRRQQGVLGFSGGDAEFFSGRPHPVHRAGQRPQSCEPRVGHHSKHRRSRRPCLWMDGGRAVELDPHKCQHLDHGYAMTCRPCPYSRGHRVDAPTSFILSTNNCRDHEFFIRYWLVQSDAA